MKLKLSELVRHQPIDKVRVHSLDMSLYRVTAEMKSREYWLTEEDGQPLSRHSLMEIRELLEPVAMRSLVLCHRSAYDEMIGHPPKGDNLLEVTLGENLYPPLRVLS